MKSLKFKGFNKLPRWLNKMLFENLLTLDEFGILLIYVMNADYGRNFGVVCLSNVKIGKIKGVNRNRVSKIKQSLIRKGLIKRTGEEYGKDIMRINKFSDFQTKIDWKLKKIEREVSKDFYKSS